MKDIQISVVLPTYNEADNIIPLIDQISLFLKKYCYEIVVVDDDSPDGTAGKVQDSFKENKSIRLFIKNEDKGLAKAIRFGIEKSSGNLILVMDTDFNHNPRDISLFLSHKDSSDLIVGSRYIGGGGMENRVRFYLSLIYNYAIRKILGLTTYDNLSGFFLINKEKFLELPADKIFIGYGDYFIRLLFFAHKMKLNITEIPVFYNNRRFGQSKSKFISMFTDYTRTVMHLLLNEKN